MAGDIGKKGLLNKEGELMKQMRHKQSLVNLGFKCETRCKNHKHSGVVVPAAGSTVAVFCPSRGL